MSAAARAFVGLGSNLEDPARQVRRAFGALAELPATRLVQRSALYRSPPLGPPGQPHYVNAVAALETGLTPRALLAALQALEARQGRVRAGVRWGPRTLDLDLLLYGAQCLCEEGLTVPHPHLHERAFVLYPLHEVAPCLEIPGRGPLVALLERVPARGLRVVAEE